MIAEVCSSFYYAYFISVDYTSFLTRLSLKSLDCGFSRMDKVLVNYVALGFFWFYKYFFEGKNAPKPPCLSSVIHVQFSLNVEVTDFRL